MAKILNDEERKNVSDDILARAEKVGKELKTKEVARAVARKEGSKKKEQFKRVGETEWTKTLKARGRILKGYKEQKKIQEEE